MTKMTNITKRLLAAAVAGALLMPAIASAQAEPRYTWQDRYNTQPKRQAPAVQQNHHHKKKKNNDVGAAVAAGIIGLAAGAILLGATRQSNQAAPARNHQAPHRYQPAPRRDHVRANGHGRQPWSPGWYRYCSSKFRSFNPKTGTYITYGGREKFCR